MSNSPAKTKVPAKTLAEYPVFQWRIKLPGVRTLEDLINIGYREVLWWNFHPFCSIDKKYLPEKFREQKKTRFFTYSGMLRLELKGRNVENPISLEEAIEEARKLGLPNIHRSRYWGVKVKDNNHIFLIRRYGVNSVITRIDDRPANEFSLEDLRRIRKESEVLKKYSTICQMKSRIRDELVCDREVSQTTL